MDRQIVYPGSIPLDTDVLTVQRNVMVALGYLAQATLGTATIADGLACTPTSPASLTINIGPGSITQFGVVDTTGFGSLPALSDPLLRIGVNLESTQFTLAAPSSAGQSINYLVEGSLLELDTAPLVLPYYNALNPSQPYSGPGNTGTAQVTQRLQTVQLQVKAGAPSATGTQATPSADQGWGPLYIIEVTYGVSGITSANIIAYPTAPFVAYKLPQLTPGTHNLASFGPTTQGGWRVPPGVSAVKVRIWGGGGTGGNGYLEAGGGGAGGGYCEGFYGVTPGEVISVIVGNGGAGAGSSGGASSFGGLASAGGGMAGANGGSDGGGLGAASGGVGASSTGFSVSGTAGGSAFAGSSSWISGAGGGAFGSAGAVAVIGASQNGSVANVGGASGVSPGSGGSGGVGAGLGGNGGPGLVLVEW